MKLQLLYDPTIMVVVNTRNHNHFMLKNYILNELDNTLYDVYSLIKSAKIIREYSNKTKDTGMKKFIVDKFICFKIVELRIIKSQIQDFRSSCMISMLKILL